MRGDDNEAKYGGGRDWTKDLERDLLYSEYTINDFDTLEYLP